MAVESLPQPPYSTCFAKATLEKLSRFCKWLEKSQKKNSILWYIKLVCPYIKLYWYTETCAPKQNLIGTHNCVHCYMLSGVAMEDKKEKEHTGLQWASVWLMYPYFLLLPFLVSPPLYFLIILSLLAFLHFTAILLCPPFFLISLFFKDHSHFISLAKCLGGTIFWNTDSILGGKYTYMRLKQYLKHGVLSYYILAFFSIPSWTKFNCKRIKVTYRLVLTDISLLICASMWVGNGYSSQAIYFALICNNWAPQLFILSLLPANSDTSLRKLSWLTNNFGYAESFFFLISNHSNS